MTTSALTTSPYWANNSSRSELVVLKLRFPQYSFRPIM